MNAIVLQLRITTVRTLRSENAEHCARTVYMMLSLALPLSVPRSSWTSSSGSSTVMLDVSVAVKPRKRGECDT